MTSIDDANAVPPVPQDLLMRLAPLCRYRRIGLAVSGGRDSVALMVLAAEAAARMADFPRSVVYTVDHGLRPDSGNDCQAVAGWARAHGLECRILRWTGDKPRTGVQAAARQARYRLMVEAGRQDGVDALVTGHHRQDQAETLLMRLGRGSGLFGLSGMAATSMMHALPLERPLLDVGRDRLEALLAARGQGWREDPSNGSRTYLRTRVRAALPALAELGLGVERLAGTAQALGRARAAIEHYTDRALAQAVTPFAGGFVALNRTVVAREPQEVGLRMLARLASAVGGRAYGPDLAKLERLLADVASDGTGGHRTFATLAGCVFEIEGPRAWIYREAGRQGLPDTPLCGRTPIVWDNRFVVGDGKRDLSGARIRALGAAGRAEAADMFSTGIPRRALETVPALVVGGELHQVAGFARGPRSTNFGPVPLRHLHPLLQGG